MRRAPSNPWLFSLFTKTSHPCACIRPQGGAKATKEDFRRYYDVVSATVPDDGYFELLLRTCWRMCVSFVALSMVVLYRQTYDP